MTDPASVWSLDPAVAHLNHGSYGATPVAVLAAQHELRAVMERNPMAFMDDLYQPALEASRRSLADFIGAETAGLVFVRNATEGANAVMQSLAPRLSSDNNVVVTSHGYNAVSNIVDLVVGLTGAEKRIVDLPFPVTSGDACVETVTAAVDDRTTLVIVDHVTSPTGLVLDVGAIVARCEPEVPVLVDGAHAPGMVPLDVASVGASFYVGNCHKWLCAAKGTGFLWVGERFRAEMRPPTVSHGMNDMYPHSGSAFHARFDWTGTDDRTAWLTLPVALATIESLDPHGWPGVMRANRRLALEARALLEDRLRLEPAAPGTMIAALAALTPLSHTDPWGLKRTMRENGFEFALTPWLGDSIVVRVSAQRYNTIDEYERFADALAAMLT